MKNALGDTNYLLLMKWVVVNVFGVVVVWVIWQTGWIMKILDNDTVYMVRIILALFFLAHAECTFRIWKTSRELNIVNAYIKYQGLDNETYRIESGNSRLAIYLRSLVGCDASSRHVLADDFRENMLHKISSVGYNLPRLTTLGLIGTFIGIIIALEGFDVSVLSDPSKIIDLFKNIPPGLRIAFHASLVGMCAYVWLDYLFQILQGGTQQLVSAIIKAGVYREQI